MPGKEAGDGQEPSLPATWLDALALILALYRLLLPLLAGLLALVALIYLLLVLRSA